MFTFYVCKQTVISLIAEIRIQRTVSNIPVTCNYRITIIITTYELYLSTSQVSRVENCPNRETIIESLVVLCTS